MSDRAELDAACDCAPFDRVEALARRMCEEAGGEWDRSRTRRAHWRARASEALEGAEVPPDFATLAAICGWMLALLLGGALVLR